MRRLILKRNTPQLAATGIKGIRIQLRLGSALPGSIFMRRRLGCPAACCAWVRRRRFTEGGASRSPFPGSGAVVTRVAIAQYSLNYLRGPGLSIPEYDAIWPGQVQIMEMRFSEVLLQEFSADFPEQSPGIQAQPFRLGCDKAGAIMRLRTASAPSRLIIFMTFSLRYDHHNCYSNIRQSSNYKEFSARPKRQNHLHAPIASILRA